METVGQKPTNYNPKIHKFVDGEWWYYYPENGTSITTGRHVRERVSVRSKRNSKHMVVDGKYISQKHPLYKPGRYKSFEHAAFESLKNYSEAKEGQVYILYSPAYPSWCKIGMAVDARDRLRSFQTGTPYRDYILVASYDVPDRRQAETEAHNLLRETHASKNEWFVVGANVAKNILDGHFNEND